MKHLKFDDGSYQIIAKCTGDANCLTNYQGSTSDSTTITSRPINGTHNDQSWYFEPVEGSRITTSMTYTESGRQPASVTDALGNTTTYSYSNGSDTSERLLTSTTDAAGTVTTYSYNGADQLTSVTSDGKTVTYGYSNDRLTTIGHNNFTYTFTYDEFGNTSSIQAGSHNLVSNQYLPHNGMISKSTYGNEQYVEYSYTEDEQVSQVAYNGTSAFTYRYDSTGNVTEMTDVASGVTYYYTTDLIGRPTVMRTNHGQALQVSYDEKNRIDAIISDVKGTTTETGFTYGDGTSGKPKATITDVSIDGTDQVTYTYDNLGRLSSKTTGTGEAATVIQYSYKGTSAGTSTLVSQVNEDDVYTAYNYDNLGNIYMIVVINNGSTSTRDTYSYDSLGQLVRHDDPVQGKSYTYTYDSGGNIVSKSVYDYVFKYSTLGEPLDTITYGYTDTSWKDMMTSYDGQTITYDTIGNPLTYRDGMSFNWIRGRRLGTLTVGDTTATYTYDDNGIRTSKTVNGVKTNYYLNGSTILTQICGSTRLDFFYDEQGSVIGFKYNNGIYLYQKNIQGDIIGIENSSGTQVVAYSYDAWGKILSITGSESTTIGQLNPFRYRGYYYDEESGLYYLNSRYYDAETGRFVNADSQLNTNAGMTGYNLFAYCGNNPITRADAGGNSWKDKLKKFGRGVADGFTGFFTGIVDTVKNIPGIVKGAIENPVAALKTYAKMAVLGVVDPFGGYRKIYKFGKAVISGDMYAAGTVVGGHVAESATAIVAYGASKGVSVLKANNTTGIKFPGNDPTVCNIEGFEWLGSGPPGSGKGNFVNMKTGEWLHPDLNHGPPIGAHWDYGIRGSSETFRIFPDDTILPK